MEQQKGEIYGFIEPQYIQKSGNKKPQMQQYMQDWMSGSNRHVYLAPYIEGLVFELILLMILIL